MQTDIYAAMDIGRLNEHEHKASTDAGANVRRVAEMRSMQQLVLFKKLIIPDGSQSNGDADCLQAGAGRIFGEPR